MAITNFKNNVSDKQDKELPAQPKPCTSCFRLTGHEILVKYGSLCEPCYQSYCRQAPAYMPELDKYKGDQRGWAKRIIDKHEAGIKVSQISLKFAQEALR